MAKTCSLSIQICLDSFYVVTFLAFCRLGQLYIVSHFIITTALQGIVISVFKRGKLICGAKAL